MVRRERTRNDCAPHKPAGGGLILRGRAPPPRRDRHPITPLPPPSTIFCSFTFTISKLKIFDEAEEQYGPFARRTIWVLRESGKCGIWVKYSEFVMAEEKTSAEVEHPGLAKVKAMWDRGDFDKIDRMVRYWEAVENLGLIGTLLQRFVIWLGVIIGAYLAFNSYVLEWMQKR